MDRPPNQFNFLEILNITFEKTDTDKKEMYSWGFQHKQLSCEQIYCS